MRTTKAERALAPNLLPYDILRDYIRALHRVSASVYRGFQRRVINIRGTRTERVDWSDPDSWIPQRLAGMERKVARRIWERSDHRLNPRYVDGPWCFTRTHGLLEADEDGFIRITDRGRAFLDGDPETVAEIDRHEGLLALLAIVAARGPAKQEALYPDWEVFCLAHTGYQSPTSIDWALRARLRNLRERDLIGQTGYSYTLTEAGAAYLEAESDRVEHVPGPPRGAAA